ncbi:MAG: Eco57I restriction-modification methylase domain-containing protein, partial [Candidatus Thorarchaeota archaeon]
MSGVKVENFESVLNAIVEQVDQADIVDVSESEARIVMGKIEVTGQKILLLVKKVESYNEVKEIRKQIFESRSEFGLDVVKYAILYQDNSYVYFIYDDPYEPKPKLIRRDLTSNLGSFKKKFGKFIKDFRNPSAWAELFDRTDIIEDFYELYLKVWGRIQEVLETQVTSEERRKIVADNLLIQLMIIWYLQEKGFLNGDTRYLVKMFKEYKDLGYSSYFEFLNKLFQEMMSEPNDEKGIYRISNEFGKIVVTGAAPFINGKNYFEGVEIPDELFYKEGATEYLKKTEPKKIKDGDERLAILNFLESRDWTEGNIDEYVLGALFEKLMTSEERKEKGAYYTPDEITNYICNNTIRPYLVDRVNEELETKFESLDKLFEKVVEMDRNEALKVLKTLYKYLQEIKILDPAVGSGHFLESAIDVLVNIYRKLIKAIEDLGIGEEKDENGRHIFSIKYADKDGSIKDILLTSLSEEELELGLKFHIIISSNIYGVDIMPNAIKIARARMFLTLAKHFVPEKVHVRFPNIHFNLRVGNSLIGFVDLDAFKRFDGNKSLLDFFDIYGDDEEGKREIRKFELSLDDDLKEYVERMDRILNTQAFRLYQDIKNLYNLNISKELIIKVLKLRNDLIKILLVSLNSDYAIKLKDFIDGLTEVFNKRLNEEFIKYLKSKGITLSESDLERIGYFHWIMEFSEVFLEKGGFDVVVGNPPHGNILGNVEKEIIKAINSSTQLGNILVFDISISFICRAEQLLRSKSFMGYIIPKSIFTNTKLSPVKRYLTTNFKLTNIVYVGLGFVGVGFEQIIFTLERSSDLKNVRDVSLWIALPLESPIK